MFDFKIITTIITLVLITTIYWDIKSNKIFATPYQVSVLFPLLTIFAPIILFSTEELRLISTNNFLISKVLLKEYSYLLIFFISFNFSLYYSKKMKIRVFEVSTPYTLNLFLLVLGLISSIYFFILLPFNTSSCDISFISKSDYIFTDHLKNCGVYYNQYGYGIINIFSSFGFVFAIVNIYKKDLLGTLAKLILFLFVLKLYVMDRKTGLLSTIIVYLFVFFPKNKNTFFKNYLVVILFLIAIPILIFFEPTKEISDYVSTQIARINELLIADKLLKYYDLDPFIIFLAFDNFNIFNLADVVNPRYYLYDFLKHTNLNQNFIIDNINITKSIGLSPHHLMIFALDKFYYLYFMIKGAIFGILFYFWKQNDYENNLYLLFFFYYINDMPMHIETILVFLIVFLFTRRKI